MKTLLISTFAALLALAGPALASDRHGPPGGGGHPGGGCMGSCGGGHPGGGYGGGGHPGGGYGGGHPGYGGGNVNTNVNVNVNASASASARAYSSAGAVINARGYDVGAIRGGGGYGGAIVSGSGYGGWDSLGYGGSAGAVVVRGPGYGPSQPFGYAVRGFGRHYVTTDRCGSCGAPPPPPSCYDRCGGGYDAGYNRGNRYSDRGDHYDRRDQGGHGRPDCDCEGPRYVAQPYYAAPLEPVDDRGYGYHGGYARQGASAQSYESRSHESREYTASYGAEARGYVSAPVHVQPTYAPQPVYAPPQEYAPRPTYAPEPQYAPQAYAEPMYEPAPYAPPPVTYDVPPPPPPADYYGDLPPGDDGVSMPYRQEPGERG